MDGGSKVEVGSDADLKKDMTVAGDVKIGGGLGLLPEISVHDVQVYADSTFRGTVRQLSFHIMCSHGTRLGGPTRRVGVGGV